MNILYNIPSKMESIPRGILHFSTLLLFEMLSQRKSYFFIMICPICCDLIKIQFNPL